MQLNDTAAVALLANIPQPNSRTRGEPASIVYQTWSTSGRVTRRERTAFSTECLLPRAHGYLEGMAVLPQSMSAKGRRFPKL